MKNIFVNSFLSLFISFSFGQSSLDSLRLVIPTFHQQELGSNMVDPLGVYVSENEKYLLSHERLNNNLILWDIRSTKKIKEIKINGEDYKFIGDDLICFFEDDKLCLYDLLKDSIILTFKDIKSDSYKITNYHICILRDGIINIYDKRNFTLIRELTPDFFGGSSLLKIDNLKIISSKDNLLLISIGNSLIVYDIFNELVKTRIKLKNLDELTVDFGGYNSNVIVIKTKKIISIYEINLNTKIVRYKIKKNERIFLRNDLNYLVRIKNDLNLIVKDKQHKKTHKIYLKPEPIFIPNAGIENVFILDLFIDKDSNRLVTFDFGEYGIKYWNLDNGKFIKKVKTDNSIFGDIIKLKKNKLLTSGTYLTPITIRNLSSGNVQSTLFGKMYNADLSFVSKNKLILNNYSDSLYVLDLKFKNFPLISDLIFDSLNIRENLLNENMELDSLNKIRIYNKINLCFSEFINIKSDFSIGNEIEVGPFINYILGENSFVSNHQNNLILKYFSDKNEIQKFDLNTCKTIKFHFSDDMSSILDSNSNFSIKFALNGDFILIEKRLYDLKKDGLASVFVVQLDSNYLFKYAPEKPFKFAHISTDNKFLIIHNFDNSFDFFDLKFKIKRYSLIPLKNNNWLIKLSNSPYYMCSKDASKMLHYVTPSLKVIGFEQLDPVYNRPDIVLDSIGRYFGNSDRGMIDNYRIIWDKRIDRLGLDKEKLGKGEIAVPSAEIIGAENIAYENKDGKLDLTISANDLKYPLRRFNVFVNEVPLYGSAGISIAHLKKQKWDTVVHVPLSLGVNKIQVSVMNDLGLENFKYPTYVNYIPVQNIVSKTYFIGIGVNEFKDSKHNLKYCVKDVTDLSKRIKDSNSFVKLFTNSTVTRENILGLKDYLNKNTTINDKVIISCSSHGLLDDSRNFYLAMHDVDFDNPKKRGLKYEELENLLDGIPARQKLLLLDACNSGENDKTEILKQELKQNNKNMDTIHLFATRSLKVNFEEENKSNFKKMNELFVNVRNNTGAVIISAAGGQESALEAIEVDGEEIENGAFTYSILECLELNKGKELKVNQLKNYTEKRVEQITKGKQIPTSRQETMEIDWIVR